MVEPKYVTLVSGESPCRGIDGLTDGFMQWLGKDRVRPYLVLGPSADIPEFGYFKPVYDWSRQGTWDWTPSQSELLILSMRSIEKVNDWINDQKFQCAVATVDVRDKPPDETLTLSPPMSSVQVSFKLELTYTSQSPSVFSCPIGLVPETLPPLKPYAQRSIPILCCLGDSNITRQSLSQAVKRFPEAKVVTERLPREEYLKLLLDSQMAIACYGGGFNSYRYWEIPACGALLIAQPLPLLIPHNFRMQQEALFYMSPVELMGVLRWALDHPTECEAIATAGTKSVVANHLMTHRAQYLTGIVQAKIQEHVAQEATMSFPW